MSLIVVVRGVPISGPLIINLCVYTISMYMYNVYVCMYMYVCIYIYIHILYRCMYVCIYI